MLLPQHSQLPSQPAIFLRQRLRGRGYVAGGGELLAPGVSLLGTQVQIARHLAHRSPHLGRKLTQIGYTVD